MTVERVNLIIAVLRCSSEFPMLGGYRWHAAVMLSRSCENSDPRCPTEATAKARSRKYRPARRRAVAPQSPPHAAPAPASGPSSAAHIPQECCPRLLAGADLL